MFDIGSRKEAFDKANNASIAERTNANGHPEVLASAKKVTNAQTHLDNAITKANAAAIAKARKNLEVAKQALNETKQKVAQSPKGEGGIIELNTGIPIPKFEEILKKLSEHFAPHVIEELSKPPTYKNRERMVLMSPKEFLTLAKEGKDRDKQANIKRVLDS
jgi:hypothetical protein